MSPYFCLCPTPMPEQSFWNMTQTTSLLFPKSPKAPHLIQSENPSPFYGLQGSYMVRSAYVSDFVFITPILILHAPDTIAWLSLKDRYDSLSVPLHWLFHLPLLSYFKYWHCLHPQFNSLLKWLTSLFKIATPPFLFLYLVYYFYL